MLLLLCSTGVFAQDVIVKKDGSTIVCRVVELTSSEIVYKKWSDLNGSNYVMNRTDASGINYQDGKKVNLSEATNLYMPNNQNDGVQQYNDKALLELDKSLNTQYKKAKQLRTIGWVGGAALFAAGATFTILYSTSDEVIKRYEYVHHKKNDTYIILGSTFMGSGVLWTTTFLLLAKKAQNSAESSLLNSSIYHKNFNLGNGNSLSAGVDLLKDNITQHQTLGLGLRYNF